MAGCFPPISLKVLESMSQQRCVWYNVVQHEAALGGGAAGRRAGRGVASLETSRMVSLLPTYNYLGSV